MIEIQSPEILYTDLIALAYFPIDTVRGVSRPEAP